jgi:hypothetical protein
MRLSTYIIIRLALACAALAPASAHAQSTEVRYLSGTGNDSSVMWEFRVSGGRRAGQWASIPVPSNWEMQGFGTYHYHRDWGPDAAPDSVGEYRLRFRVPESWRDRTVEIVFGGSMTDTEVRINGRSAGPVHQGGFYQFRYDVTPLLHYGAGNLMEVTVHKFSADPSVNRAEREADFWLFGGIYRPVWLEAYPRQHIERIALDARQEGALSAEVHLEGLTAPGHVVGQVERLDGTPVGAAFSAPASAGQEVMTLNTTVAGVKPWSPEWPNRYRLRLRLVEDGRTLHEITQAFGFRTVEVRPHDGVYVNGVKVHIKGVNRHTFWPTTGRTTSRAISEMDVKLIKEMNMNAARMSHYPPDTHFLDVADSLGLFVLDELTGWQAHYDTDVGRKLVREMVVRDVNHPSIIFWDNGNEGGFNFDLDPDFAKWDPQHRTVLHPWLDSNGIDTGHYEVYDCCTGRFLHGDDLVMPTEFLHALYDGGGGAGLADWWALMRRDPLGVGGFLWALLDEGVVRADENGRIDTAGNSAPDGVLGPFRQKEGSFYTIREVWAPIYFEWGEEDRLPPTFTGALRVENRYDFTDLKQVRFHWRLVDFRAPGATQGGHTVAAEGAAPSPEVAPHGIGTLHIPLPADWSRHDALFLTATDPHGKDVYTWTWMIPRPADVAERIARPGTGRAWPPAPSHPPIR